MNRHALFLSLLLCGGSALTAFPQREHKLDEVVVTGARAMKDIGVQATSIDSLALKENIALSMADVLTFNSGVFVKSHGRATLSTVAFRGTSPSHTQVTWNGMNINSPMMGMTDFSTIPSYFIDQATLLHGTSSVNETGGGLGGLVKLATLPDVAEGIHLQYVQGIGSFSTFDEFLRFTCGSEKWGASTRVVYSSSPNDYTYTNHDKKVNIYDDDKNIVGQYYPKEKNRSGAYKDFHILEEVYFTPGKGNRFGLNAWYADSNRELPLLTTDYASADFENRQKSRSFRGLLFWKHRGDGWNSEVSAGYIHDRLSYDYKRDLGNGILASMTASRTRVNTVFGKGEGAYTGLKNWLFTLSLSGHQHFVRSLDKSILIQDGEEGIIGFDVARLEMSASASAKWQPTRRLGMSAVLRQEVHGRRLSPLIPAFFIDVLLSQKGYVMAKGSISRNHRAPSLNDLYFLPGGNPDLKEEHGFSYDLGLSASAGSHGRYALRGSVTWFDSRIDDWILWLPTTKGFFSPRNVKRVHAYGIEVKGDLGWQIAPRWLLDLNATYSWTPSINSGKGIGEGDKSVGKQLPYVPKHAASVTGRLSWGSWSFLYKWAFYSKRYTMSSNEETLSGRLPTYFMSNVSLGKGIVTRHVDFDLKLAVNNLFNEDYISVLSHPMPGINFEFFVSITPKFL